MGLFDGLFTSLRSYVRWDFQVDRALSSFRDTLKKEKKIRLWVTKSPGYGHQSASIAILRQLANPLLSNGFAYAGTIEVYYEEAETLPKIYKLLPELKNQPQGKVENAAVELYEWTSSTKPPVDVVLLGVTGGADLEGTDGPQLAQRLSTTFFLRLQPYRWGAPEQLQFLDAKLATLTLTKERVLGYGSFTDRAYYMPMPVPQPAWNGYQGEEAKQAKIVQVATSTKGLAQVPVYSIRSKGNLEMAWPADDRMFNVLLAVLAAQRSGSKPAPGASPTMILSCDTFEKTTFTGNLESLLGGGMTQTEKSWDLKVSSGKDIYGFDVPPKELSSLKTRLQGRDRRIQYLKDVDAKNRVKLIWPADDTHAPDPDEVEQALKWLMGDPTRVLFVQVNRLPGALFDYLTQQTALFPVFEGQNTANLLFNLGNPYFHVSRPSSFVTQYPTTLVNYDEYDVVDTGADMMPFIFIPREPRILQDKANQVNYTIEQWPARAADNPAEILGAFIQAYQAESNKGTYHTYFKSIRDFYQTPPNDKLRYGLAFLNYIQGTLKKKSLAALADDAPVLETLYQTLLSNTDPQKNLNLIPGVFSSGSIFDIYQKLLASGALQITSASITKTEEAGQIVSVQAAGDTASLGFPLGATFTFTARGTTLTAGGRFTYTERWAPPELPWLVFSDPFVELSTIDAEMPTVGRIGGTIESAGVELAVKLPVTDGQWQLEATFHKPYPSIAKFYALAGGANLTAALPAPFGGLAGFGVSKVQLAFDSTTGAVRYVGVGAATQSTFDLLPNLTVQNIGAQITVQDPAGPNRGVDWQVQGSVKIGGRPDSGVLLLGARGPVLTLNGALASGVLRLSDLFSVFLPGMDFQPQSEPSITEFQAAFTPSTGDYSFGCLLNIDYTLSVIGKEITLQSLSLSGSRTQGLVMGSIGATIAIQQTPPLDPFLLFLSASYQGGQWIFRAAQAGAPLSLTALFNQFLPSGWTISKEYALDGLAMTVALGDKSYLFEGKTAEAWEVPFIDGLSVKAGVRAGYLGKATDKQPVGPFGRIETDWRWEQIAIQVWYDYSPAVQQFGITWGALKGTVTGPNADGDWVASLGFSDNVTIGYLIETMVSWATGSRVGLESPWDLLDKIPLSGLSLDYTFNKNKPERNKVTFGVNIGPIELGFARIDGIEVGYESTGPSKGVMVTLKGSFPWNVGADAKGSTSSLGPWDATQPGAAPAPAGNGNKYLDLRMLAMGQHVTAACLPSATTVQKAIQCLGTLPDTTPGKIPPIQFDPQSSWLFGADFGVLKIDPAQNGGKPGYFLTLQTVFNDPHLYGLRVALDGPAAKVLKGLDFQIMYRQVSPTVGVYQAEITLPDVMRYLSVGAYSITLPVFGISVYTNGDFLVDIGFPYNADFSRSFSVEAIIYPGIPVMGSAGLYFGKLSSASTSLVPQADNGTFNPVIVFGFGLQVGFGKSIRYGILSAGFSLTLAGILEGVLGKWNPYQGPDDSGTSSQIQGAYYFWLRGTVGILGNLFGTVDFAIVKASVNVDIKLLLQLTYESFVSIAMTVIVSVDASASIEINLGLFKIKISFSFSLRVKESFSIDNLGTPPWHVPGKARSLLRRPADDRLSALRRSRALTAAAEPSPVWSNLLAPPAPAPLTGYFSPALTAAADEWAAPGDLASQVPCYVSLLFIDSVPSIHELAARRASGAPADGGDTPFETLCKTALRWVIAAVQPGPLTAAQVDDVRVCPDTLTDLLDRVLKSSDDRWAPIPGDAMDTFLQQQFRLTLRVPPNDSAEADATCFPVPGALGLVVPPYGDAYPGYAYSFGGYNEVSTDTLKKLRERFDELAIRVSQEMQGEGAALLRDGDSSTSMSEWVFSDYFLLIARQMVQAARDSLRTFRMPIVPGQTAAQAVAWINTTGQLTGEDAYTLLDLFVANPAHPLTAGKAWTIDASYASLASDTFGSIAGLPIFAGAFTAAALATQNADAAVLAVGQKVTYPSRPPRVVQPGDTLNRVAAALGVTLAQLLSDAGVLSQAGLLAPLSTLKLPVFQSMTAEGDTLLSLAGRFGITIDALADRPENGQIADPFSTSDPELDVPHLPRFRVGDLISEVQRTGGLHQLSAMVARYHLHGLRIPTDGITPKQMGIWVKKGAAGLSLPAEAGLFALTGQMIPLPDITGSAAFSLRLTRTSGPDWIQFVDGAGEPVSELDISVAPGGQDALRIQSVASFARSTRLDVAADALGAGVMVESDLATYPFASPRVWQSASPVSLPYGPPPSGISSPAIYTLPPALAGLPDPAARAMSPRIALRKGRHDEATGGTIKTDVESYGLATVVPFVVKRVPAAPGAPASESTYEIAGAGGADVVLLERMVAALQGDDSAFQRVAIGYAPDPAGARTEGIQTDAEDLVTFGIAQVNLSTVTRPTAAKALLAGAAAPAAGMLNSPSELVRLLWEATITNAGGFFLYYHASGEDRGLPDRLFDDKGEATLSLVVVHARPPAAGDQNRLTGYMNAVVVGDAVGGADTVVFAEADPPADPMDSVLASATATLADLAFGSYSELGDLAAANASLPLAAGKPIAVTRGTFQAPPGGIALADVAARYQTTVEALQNANPKWQGKLPDPLPFPVAIRLPALALPAGSSPSTGTLGDIATFVGQDLTSLAADNDRTPGLFQVGQVVRLPGGPRLVRATVPAGVQSVLAVRKVPEDVPQDPKDPRFAELFLLHGFTLLSQRIAENKDFEGSHPGLPAGPTTSPADPTNPGKVRAPRQLAAGDRWDYKLALPYSRYASPSNSGARAPAGRRGAGRSLPGDGDESPYLGVGGLLQVGFDWLDHFGNRIVTALSSPAAGDAGPYNEAPISIGYTDPLIGLGQWPQIASTYLVAPDPGTGAPAVVIDLTFDRSAYEGVLSAAATSATAITIAFTQALDPATAGDPRKYTVGGGVAVQGASLDATGRIVTLQVSALTQGEAYSLVVSGVLLAGGSRTVSGQAGFAYPDVPDKRSSSVQANARRDLRVYSALRDQLTDPNGISATVASSLFSPAITLTGAQMAGIRSWLFDGTSPPSILAFLTDRAQLGTGVAAPAASQTLALPLSGVTLNPAEIYELSLSFVLTRTGAAVLGQLAATDGIRSVSTSVAPLSDGLDGGSTLGLTRFATSFQSTLSQPGSYLAKVATGLDREAAGSDRKAALWAVRVGSTIAEPISFAVPSGAGGPAVFAPRPISNKLESRAGVEIHDYERGSGLSPAPTRSIDFLGVDMDVWGRRIFAAVDGVLTPTFTASMQIVGRLRSKDYLRAILDAKAGLADIVKDLMVPVFEGDTSDPAAARDAFRQQLLVALGNAYTTAGALTYTASVHADIAGPPGAIPPRLYGTVSAESPTSGSDASKVSFTSPKLTLATAEAAPLSFLVSAPEVVRGAQGEVLPCLDLDLTFTGDEIEHQIGRLPGSRPDDPYLASSWLRFVVTDAASPWSQHLGAVALPLPLRAFPASPTLVRQSAAGAGSGSGLAALLRYDYDVCYSLPFHYPQDRVYGRAEFNLGSGGAMLESLVDAFPQMARFVTVFPQVQADLVGLLATIDASVDPVADKQKIDDSAIALDSFLTLACDIIDAAGAAGLALRGHRAELRGAPGLTFSFHVEEGSASVKGTEDALLVTLVGDVPPGIGIPSVLIQPDLYDAVPYAPPVPVAGRLSYVYRIKGAPDERYLTAADGQAIADRVLRLPALDVLQRQDALTTLYLQRNEELVQGKPTASAFVYTTPEVAFSNPLRPTLSSDEPLDLTALGTGARSLADYLTDLFAALLANNQEPTLTLQVAATYEHRPNPSLSPIDLPVMMQAPLCVAVTGAGPGTLAQMVADWASAILVYFQAHAPACGGRLFFDLLVFSNLTSVPMPLVRLSRLFLPVAALQPPLPCRAAPARSAGNKPAV